MAQAAQLALPSGADAIDLIVPRRAVAETRVDETEPRAALARVDCHLDDNGRRFRLAIVQRLAVHVVRSRLLVYEPDEPRRIPRVDADRAAPPVAPAPRHAAAGTGLHLCG